MASNHWVTHVRELLATKGVCGGESTQTDPSSRNETEKPKLNHRMDNLINEVSKTYKKAKSLHQHDESAEANPKNDEKSVAPTAGTRESSKYNDASPRAPMSQDPRSTTPFTNGRCTSDPTGLSFSCPLGHGIDSLPNYSPTGSSSSPLTLPSSVILNVPDTVPAVHFYIAVFCIFCMSICLIVQYVIWGRNHSSSTGVEERTPRSGRLWVQVTARLGDVGRGIIRALQCVVGHVTDEAREEAAEREREAGREAFGKVAWRVEMERAGRRAARERMLEVEERERRARETAEIMEEHRMLVRRVEELERKVREMRRYGWVWHGTYWDFVPNSVSGSGL